MIFNCLIFYYNHFKFTITLQFHNIIHSINFSIKVERSNQRYHSFREYKEQTMIKCHLRSLLN